jgi:CopG-like RHH_1 or ribbon-helix-helix domain, RHH_5
MTGVQSRRSRAGAPGLERSHADDLSKAEIVPTQPNPSSPISIRLSAPLIERLDRLAQREHRKRSNLIQHILWEYVHAHDV